jgi:hypothetical protein
MDVTGVALNFSHFNDKVNNTWTVGMMPFARWYLYRSKPINFFFQYGAGVSYSFEKFPLTGTGWEADTARTGTQFNFLSKVWNWDGSSLEKEVVS